MNWNGANKGVVKAATNWLKDLSAGTLPAGITAIGPIVYDPRTAYKGRIWAMGLHPVDRTNKFTYILYSDDHGDTWVDSGFGDIYPRQTLNGKLNMTSGGHFIWSSGSNIYRTSSAGVSSTPTTLQPDEYSNWAYNWQWGEFSDGTVITGAYAPASEKSIETAGSDPLSGFNMNRSTDGATVATWEHKRIFDTKYPPVTGIVQHWHYVSVDPFTDTGWACTGDGVYNGAHSSNDNFDTLLTSYEDDVDFVGLGFSSNAVWGGEDKPGVPNYIKALDKNGGSNFENAIKLPDDIENQSIFHIKCSGNDLYAATWHHDQGGYSTLLKYNINGVNLTLDKRFPVLTDNTNTDIRGICDMNGVIPEWSDYIYLHIWDEVTGNTETCYRVTR